MNTCKTCIYKHATINPQNKEMVISCVRFPPQMHLIHLPQGVATTVSYPVVNDNFVACGEWDDGLDIVVDDEPEPIINQ